MEEHHRRAELSFSCPLQNQLLCLCLEKWQGAVPVPSRFPFLKRQNGTAEENRAPGMETWGFICAPTAPDLEHILNSLCLDFLTWKKHPCDNHLVWLLGLNVYSPGTAQATAPSQMRAPRTAVRKASQQPYENGAHATFLVSRGKQYIWFPTIPAEKTG